jgi:uncharacterized protein involved in exopolysaccharide biosynthesis
VRLESRLDQTDIAVLNAAVPPLVPVFPKIPLNVVLSVIIGSMLGVGAALLMEMMNRRVRSRDDLAYAAGIPVLAEVSRLTTRKDVREASKAAAVAKAMQKKSDAEMKLSAAARAAAQSRKNKAA